MSRNPLQTTNGNLRALSGFASALLALSGFALAADAPAAKRAFTIEDLYRVKTPSSIALSPDGGTVVFSLSTKDFGRGKAQTDLYRVPAAGGEVRRLTFTDDKSEGSPFWSPDGRTIAFVAKRGEHEGLWLLPVDGGEARKLVEVGSGIESPTWSPDGRYIGFVSQVFPECGADDACNAKLAKWREDGPLKVHVTDELLYRHWTGWYDGRVNHVLIADVTTGKLRDLTPGDRESPVFTVGGGGAFAFSPDGRTLAFTRNPDPVATLASSTNSDIFVVPVDPAADGSTPAARDLTAANKAADTDPRFSPDGRWLAFRRQKQPGYESDLWQLAVIELATGEVRVVSDGIDNWITTARWLGDSSGFVFEAEVGGQTPLYRLPLAGGKAEQVAAFAFLDELELSKDGRSAYVVRRAIASPPEVWRLDLAGKDKPLRLSEFNRQLENEVDIRPAESVLIDGANGHKVQTWVVKPHGFDPAKKYPVVLNVHGGPQSQWADSFRGDWQVYPGSGYVVVFPNPHGSTGFGQAYTAEISGDWSGKVMEDVSKVTDWIAAQPWADKDRIGAMGWSWGGYAMNWLQATSTRYKCLASMMGVFDPPSMFGSTEELWFPEWEFKGQPWNSPLYERDNPARLAKNFRTPQLVITGELDYRVPYTQSLMAYTYLRRQGVPAKLVVFPNAGHWPSWYEMALYYTAHLEWFHQYLGGDGPPWSTADFAANKVFDFETGQKRK